MFQKKLIYEALKISVWIPGYCVVWKKKRRKKIVQCIELNTLETKFYQAPRAKNEGLKISVWIPSYCIIWKKKIRKKTVQCIELNTLETKFYQAPI